jgi:peptidoglycan/LPS O-acetylase OafA/YrhL
MQKYRPEIDGLRAVAVIPVILFHAGFESFSGGYVGVDVFFVISGYLITSIIYGEIQNKTFSIILFYERRARRILPALIFVSAVCIPFAWMWMLPNDFEDFSRSLVAVSVFASNIFFWRDSGYFSVAVELKPLLHTWSLGVEEQFYILFPVILLLCRKVSARATVTIVMLGTIASIVLAEFGSRTYPAATFYLIPTRAWELGIGVLLAIHAHDFGRNKIPLGQSGYRAIGDGAGVLGRAW